MEGRIYMTTKELSRLEEIQKAHQKRQTIQQAADNLRLSRRQVLRLSKALKNEDLSRAHFKEGRSSKQL